MLSWTHSLCWWREDSYSNLSAQMLHFNNLLLPLWTDSICCFKVDINWNRLPQMTHFKGFFYMVYFLHELIQYAYWKSFLHQIFYDKVHFCKVHCFHEHILCADGEKILVQSYQHKWCIWTIYFHYGQILYVVSSKTLIEVIYHKCHIPKDSFIWFISLINWFNMPIEKKISIKSFMTKFTFVRCIAFMDIFFVLMERRFLFKQSAQMVHLNNLFSLWRDSICCFIEDINWSH